MISKKEIVGLIKDTIYKELGVTVGNGHRSYDVHMLTGWHYASNSKDKYGYVILSNNYDISNDKVMSINNIIYRIFTEHQYNITYTTTKMRDNGDFYIRYQFRNQELEV